MTLLTERRAELDRYHLHRQGHSANVRIQGRTDSPEDHAGNGTHREPAVGHGTGGQNLDGKEDLAAGKRNAADYQKKGGVRMKGAWKNTSRYVYCPNIKRKIGRRVTLMDRIRRRRAQKRNVIDVFPICGYDNPVYPGK